MFENLLKSLQSFSKTVILVIQTEMQRLGKDATGETSNSLRQAFSVKSSNAIELNIFGSKAFDYIEEGRKPGAKMPPSEVLVEWLKARGIPLAAEFAIRKSITEKGIEPVPILQLSFQRIKSTFLPKLKADFLQELRKQVFAILQKELN